MVFRNRDGTAVDPVPFVVTGGSVFLLFYSFIPLYLQALGLRLESALGVTTALYGAALLTAYHRQVHLADPERRTRVPVGLRFRRLVYVMLIVGGVVVLLALPLVTG